MESYDHLNSSRFARADGQLALCHVDARCRLGMLFSKLCQLVEQLPDRKVCRSVKRLFRKRLVAVVCTPGEWCMRD